MGIRLTRYWLRAQGIDMALLVVLHYSMDIRKVESAAVLRGMTIDRLAA